MMHPSRPRRVSLAKADDQAWRARTLLACALLALGVVGLGAVNLDWSVGVAMALGQIAGLIAPMAMLVLAVWAAVQVGKKR